jgi:hypothetical protein
MSVELIGRGGWLTQKGIRLERDVGRRGRKIESFNDLQGAKLGEGRQRVEAGVMRREEETEARPRPLGKGSKHRALAVGKSERKEGSPSCRIETDRRLERDINAVIRGQKRMKEDMMRREEESEAPPRMRKRNKHRALAIGKSERSVSSPSGRDEAEGGLERDVDAVDGKRLMSGVFLKREVESRVKQQRAI